MADEQPGESPPPSSVESSAQFTSKGFPEGPEKTKSVNVDSVQSTLPKSTNVPLPAGITEAVNEKPSTVVELADTTNPFAAASPPDVPSAHPLWLN